MMELNLFGVSYAPAVGNDSPETWAHRKYQFDYVRGQLRARFITRQQGALRPTRSLAHEVDVWRAGQRDCGWDLKVGFDPHPGIIRSTPDAGALSRFGQPSGVASWSRGWIQAQHLRKRPVLFLDGTLA
jgi:hypothetical protein